MAKFVWIFFFSKFDYCGIESEVTVHKVEKGVHSVEVTVHKAEKGVHSVEVTVHKAEKRVHRVEVTVHKAEKGVHRAKKYNYPLSHKHLKTTESDA